MVRRDDKLKAELRKYYGFKNIRGWLGYGLLKSRGLSTEAIWKEVKKDYMSRVDHFKNNVSAVSRIQRAFRARPVKVEASDVVGWTSRHGDVFTDYHFQVSETDEDGMLSEIILAVRSVPKGENTMYGLMAEGDAGRVFSTGYWNTSHKAIKKFRETLQEFLIKYEQSAVVNTVVVQTLQPNVKNVSGGRSYILASKVWKIISPRSERNCAYKAVALCLNKHRHKELTTKPIELTKLGNDLKRRVKPKHTMYADDADLQLLADYKKRKSCCIIISMKR